jgi:hypothetical protein
MQKANGKNIQYSLYFYNINKLKNCDDDFIVEDNLIIMFLDMKIIIINNNVHSY